ncbi:MAG: GNAT family N-acetyltransferase [Nitrospirae bacterium]|nr:GNAT family N-acetyltransferase [Nitrospirota bacterium]MDA1303268.1 GNAT family N-acetyltransferase [Nitrospirota bacterium]
MNDPVTYRFLMPEDIPEVHELIKDVFLPDIAPHYSSEGQEEFLRYVEPDALHARGKENHFALLAVLNDEIIGVIEIRDHSHLSLLFVNVPHQRQGLSKELLRRGLESCLKNRVDVLTLTVHASPNAVGIYEKLGFRQLQPEQVSHGFRFTLMELNLLDCDLLNGTSEHN